MLRVRDLGAPARLAAFALGLALVGGIAALAGAAAGDGRVVSKDGHADEAMVPTGKTQEYRFRILETGATRFATATSTGACACT